MGKILQKIKQIQKNIQEFDNSEELNNILPTDIIFEMCHNFSNNKRYKNPEALTLFDLDIKKQLLCNQRFLYPETYKNEVAQNKLLIHGMIFKAIFDTYMELFKTSFDNVLISDLSNKTTKNRAIIDFIEYSNLPKSYRSIFIAYDNDHYVLNVPHKSIVMSYNKKDRKYLEKLLERANILIPAIYRTTEPDMNLGGLQIFESDPNKPAFIDSCAPRANLVSDEQLKAFDELRKIFVEISHITLPILTKQNEQSNAKILYNQYMQEKSKQGMFANAIKTLESEQGNRDTKIKDAAQEFNKQKEMAEQSYKDFHAKLIQKLSSQIKTNVK